MPAAEVGLRLKGPPNRGRRRSAGGGTKPGLTGKPGVVQLEANVICDGQRPSRDARAEWRGLPVPEGGWLASGPLGLREEDWDLDRGLGEEGWGVDLWI